MTKAKSQDRERGAMRAEYDFSGAVRGKYYAGYRRSSNVVVLEPDVAAVFPSAAAVNAALRVLASAAQHARPRLRTRPRAGSTAASPRRPG